MLSLNNLFQLNHIRSEEELIENDHEMLKSMFNAEPVVNLFTTFDNHFKIQESKAFLDLYSDCNNLPLNLIKIYFLPCHIQYIYIVHINHDNYYIFMYNYDSNPEMESRKQTYCKTFIVSFNEKEIINNLMGLRIFGFKNLKSLIYNWNYYNSFKNALYQSIEDINLDDNLKQYILNDSSLALYALDKSVYIKEN